MSVRIVAFMATLMQLAGELGRARRSGDPERIAAAEAKHDAYQRVCLAADQLIGGIPE